MAAQWTTTTPDPELFEAGKQHDPHSGAYAAGKTTGSPSGLNDPPVEPENDSIDPDEKKIANEVEIEQGATSPLSE